MRGRRTRKTGGVFAGIGTHCSAECNGCLGFFGAENKADAPASFAIAEWVMWVRLLD